MKLSLTAAVTAAALLGATPAIAGVTIEDASLMQGTLVHGTGEEQVAPEVIGNLGANGPNIVHFTGTTTDPATDDLRLQDGEGQADVTGAVISLGSPEAYDLITGNIFLTGYAGMDWIEFALTGADGTNGGTVDFLISLSDGSSVAFDDQLLGSGDTFFAFLANGGTSITNVFFSADTPPGSFDILKQVRIIPSDSPAVPEPATWAMMLLGFGTAGAALRRSRRRDSRMLQIA